MGTSRWNTGTDCKHVEPISPHIFAHPRTILLLAKSTRTWWHRGVSMYVSSDLSNVVAKFLASIRNNASILWHMVPATLGSGERAVALMANAILWPNGCFSKHLELPFSIWQCGNTGHFGSKNFNIDAFFGRPWMAMDGFDMGSHDRATGGQIPDRNHPWHQSSDATRNAEVRQYFKIFVWSRFLWCPSGTRLHRNSPTRAQDTQQCSRLSWHKLTCCSPWNHPTGPIQPASKLNWDTLLRPCCMIWVYTEKRGSSKLLRVFVQTQILQQGLS